MCDKIISKLYCRNNGVHQTSWKRDKAEPMGCTVTDNACLMKSSGGKSGTNLSKLLPRGCFPEKSGHEGQKRGISPGQNGWRHRFKNTSIQT